MSDDIRRQRIIQNTSITELVGEYLPLRGHGPKLQSPCPFHSDQRSTFSVEPLARSFKCSACGVSGDVVDFVRMFEGVTESEALDMLESRPKL
jgi:DNA primase